jgi:hypothetical protein
VETNIYINSDIGTCNMFTRDGKREEASIVISPLKVTEERDKKKNEVLRITSGCNLWKMCANPACQFSLVARPAVKE